MKRLMITLFIWLNGCGSTHGGLSWSKNASSSTDRSPGHAVTSNSAGSASLVYSREDELKQAITELEGIVHTRDIQIWYYLHASNRKSDFNDRFKYLKDAPEKPFMFLIETRVNGDPVEYFVSGNEKAARLVIAKFINNGEIQDVGNAVKEALIEDTENNFFFYFTKNSNLEFKKECDMYNYDLTSIYAERRPLPLNCRVASDSPRYQILKDALVNGAHFDLTKEFTDDGR